MNETIYLSKKYEEILLAVPGDNVSQKIRMLIDEYVKARK
jgi:hypothetical protein